MLMGIMYICIRCVDNNHVLEECVDLVELMDSLPNIVNGKIDEGRFFFVSNIKIQEF